MIDTPHRLEHLHACTLRYHSALSELLPDDEIETSARRRVEQGFSRLDDLAIATDFCNAMGLPGTVPQDFLHKLIHVEPYGSVVAGIRFRSISDSAMAFLELSSWSFGLPVTEQAVFELFDKIAARFPQFEVKGMRCYLPHQAIKGPLERYIEHTLYGRRLNGDHSFACDQITLRAVHPNEVEKFYPVYSHLYDLSFEANPSLTGYLSKETIEDMRAFAEEGLCFLALEQNKSVGIIAGERSEEFSPNGVAVRDIVVDPRLWGQSIGPRLHKLFYNHLEQERYTFIHGFIDKLNVASQRAARKAGRIPLFDGFMFSKDPELMPPV